MKARLLEKIERREAKIAVIGLGYVGLPRAVAFAQEGFCVVGVDVAQHRVDQLNAGTSYIDDIGDEEIQPLVASGHFQAVADYKAVADADVISICVPTPLRKTRDPDISYIISASESIAEYDARGKLIILESTTYPGTTEEIVLPRLEKDGVVGRDFFLVFSPERVDPGRKDYTLATTPKVIGGVTPACLEVGLAFYESVVEHPVPVSSTRSAEMVKLLENTFRAVNIGLVNEVALMCDKLELDVWEVVEAASTKPYGFMPFYPGPGLGGHCIPVDPHYLSWKLRTLNYTARFIELASEVNAYMPHYVVGKIADALNDRGKAVKYSRVFVVGVAFKPNVSDVRESPALDVMRLLLDKGAIVNYNDPYVPDLRRNGFDLVSCDVDEGVESADCVVIITNHASYDWDCIAQCADLIVDTRNAVKMNGNAEIVKLSA